MRAATRQKAATRQRDSAVLDIKFVSAGVLLLTVVGLLIRDYVVARRQRQ